MKTLAAITFFSMVALCPSLFAQGCGHWMTVQYSAYFNISAGNMTQSSYTLYTNSIVDGSASGTCPLGCSCSPTPTHHGSVGSNIHRHSDGVLMGSSSTNGTPVCYNCYLSTTNPLDITGVPGVVYDFQSGNEVFCSAAGLLFDAALSFSAGVSVTNYQWNQLPPVGNACQYNKQCPVPTVATCGVGTIYQAPQGGGCTPNYRWLYFLYYTTGAGTHCFQYGLVVAIDAPTPCD